MRGLACQGTFVNKDSFTFTGERPGLEVTKEDSGSKGPVFDSRERHIFLSPNASWM